MKNLVIVESPSKSKTIEKYLGKDYKVLSSKGHIRDLATTGKYGLGVDLEDNFKPNYKLMPGKTKLVNELKKEVKSSDNVILATDPDREGEAISWHLKEALDIKNDNYSRVVFNEITEPAIKEAFKHPKKIDIELVHSQESRRILDRIIGFRLSKLMQYKTDGKSAGRVQSVALKLIVDREREIEAFVPEEYYTIEADFKDFKAELTKYKNKKIEVKTSKEADDIIASLSNAYNIVNVDKKLKPKKSKDPFTTSTLTQMASTRLGYPASKTMSIAQRLYEGVSLGSETVGLISYMRTDSIRLSDLFVNDTEKYIMNNYGKEYVGYTKKTKKTENVQDAHEAIRPTSILRTPESIKKYLKPDEFKLYNLIYIRTLSSLMADAKVEATSVDLENNDYIFRANGSVLVFDGYLKVYKDFEDSEDTILPDFANYKSKVIVASKVDKIQHFTEPKSRYTEAKLIAELEKLGIGRPSTYAKIISVLEERKYVSLKDKKFYPTEIGIVVTDKLQEFFSSIINVNYTANMETELDEIADGKLVWYTVLDKFYKDFEPLLQKAFKEMEKEAPEETGETCPECGSPLVIRKGKFGKFTACSNYPECKYIKKEEKEEPIETGETCPKCGNKMVARKGRYGEFTACSNYPKCKYIKQEEPKELDETCPECGNKLVERKGRYGKFIACSNYPKCKYIKKNKE